MSSDLQINSTQQTRSDEVVASEFRTFAIGFMSVAIVAALFGNVLLLAVLIMCAGRRGFTSIQILLFNNAIADILYACVTMAPMCIEMMVVDVYGDEKVCRMVAFLRLIPMYASPYLMVSISLDRYNVSSFSLRH